jgi:hypothetical protein
MATLAGVGVGGAVGGLVGALVGMGIPEYEAKRYEGAVKGGGTLLSVHCDTSEQIDVAKQALKETGAKDISSTGEAGSSVKAGNTNYDDRSLNATARDRTVEEQRLERGLPEDDVVTTTNRRF